MSKRDRDLTAQAASRHVGYVAQQNRNSIYGNRVGLPNQTWSGSFLDVVFLESTASLDVPTFAYTPSALAYFVEHNRLFRKPKKGDIVFYAFPTEDSLAQPHVGIVTDTSMWKVNRSFKAIEAQTDSGLPRGSRDKDGVYERIRYITDVLAFARPGIKIAKSLRALNFTYTSDRASEYIAKVNSSLTNQPFTEVAEIQMQLSIKVGLRDARRGVFDNHTRSAYAKWQRHIGYGPKATGQPDSPSLDQLFDIR
jgi:hypothetical protein